MAGEDFEDDSSISDLEGRESLSGGPFADEAKEQRQKLLLLDLACKGLSSLSLQPACTKNDLLTDVIAFFQSLKCTAKDCPLAKIVQETDVSLDNVAYVLRLYSNGLFCVSVHYKKLHSVQLSNFKSITLLETYLLQNPFTMPSSLSLQNKKVMDVYCEQDIESLSIKIYERLGEREREALLRSNELLFLLSLLRVRKETERFFMVYDASDEKKNIDIFKIALLMSLETEYKDPRAIFKEIRSFLGCTEADGKCLCGEESLSPEQREYEAIKKWFSDEYRRHHWNVCMMIWKSSKEIEGAGEAMIDVCVKYREYEEGWKVYSEVSRKERKSSDVQKLSLRACYMAVRALNHTGDRLWIDRFLAVVANGTKDSSPSFIKDVILMLNDIENNRTLSFLVTQLLRLCCKVSLNCEGVKCTLEGCFCLLEQRQQEKELEDSLTLMCLRGVFDLYLLWKKTKKQSSLLSFFLGSSECTNDIYRAMLGICCKCKIEEIIRDVCEDIWNSGVTMDEQLMEHLREIHNVRCSCDRFTHLTIRKGRGRNILDHCVKVLKGQRSV